LENGLYTMDLDDFDRKITSHTKIVILCNPHNPVGRVWQKEELCALGELCLRKNILIIADEIHEDIVYPGFRHIPFTSLAPEFAANTIVCTAASKTFNLPGLQTSNIIVQNSELREKFCQTLTRFGIHNPNMMGLVATEAAYRTGETWFTQFLEYLQGNLQFLEQYIAEKMPRVKIIPPQGTYLVWLDFRNSGIVSDRLDKFVREDAKVGLEAGTIFGCKEAGFERMNIACPRSILAEGLSRIEQALNHCH
jgi:cysteine-S-conjugate beta-lyase